MDKFHARHEGLFFPEALDDKRVLLVGCGSVGSELARMLTRSGVRRHLLIDPDAVSASNVCRSVYLDLDVGAPKVEALAHHLQTIRSGIEVETCAARLGDFDDAVIANWIAGSDIVIAATDHPPTQARLGALSYQTRPAVFAGVYVKGTGGEVLWTAPEETPCYACVLGEIRGANAPARGQTEYGLATGELAAEPALGIDILHVTVCAAKIALALLLRGRGSAVEKILDPSRSVLFVGNTVDWIWREPFETVWGRAARRESCICRLGAGGSTADLFTSEELASP